MPKRSTPDPLTLLLPDAADQMPIDAPLALQAAYRDLQRLQTQWAYLPTRQRARGSTTLERRRHNALLARTRGELRVAIERAEFALANALATHAPRMRHWLDDTLPTSFELLVRFRAALMHTTLETAPPPKLSPDRRHERRRGDTVIGRTPDALLHARAKTDMRENTRALVACLVASLDVQSTLAQLTPALERLRGAQHAAD
jgi:hypothetical protein